MGGNSWIKCRGWWGRRQCVPGRCASLPLWVAACQWQAFSDDRVDRRDRGTAKRWMRCNPDGRAGGYEIRRTKTSCSKPLLRTCFSKLSAGLVSGDATGPPQHPCLGPLHMLFRPLRCVRTPVALFAHPCANLLVTEASLRKPTSEAKLALIKKFLFAGLPGSLRALRTACQHTGRRACQRTDP